MQKDGSGVDLHAVPGETGVVGFGTVSEEANNGKRMRNKKKQNFEAMLVDRGKSELL